MSIKVTNLNKRFGTFHALENVSFEVPGDGLLALLGPSGSGKSTLLRVIAGLEIPDSGQVYFDGAQVTQRPARQRGTGFVFQHYALFRHMTVFDNIGYGLKIRRRPRSEIKNRVHELLSLVGLEGYDERLPGELSGGQRQRVALARALAIEPKVLLLDEPFGALDAKVRLELRRWLRRLHDEIHVTTIFVTHDQDEAFEVADVVVVMNRGRVEQVGSPREIYDSPASPFVMDFVGQVNAIPARVQSGRAWIGELSIDCPEYPFSLPRAATLYCRPHELTVARRSERQPALAALVQRIQFRGLEARVRVRANPVAEPIEVQMPRDRFDALRLREGEPVYVVLERVRIHVPSVEISDFEI